MTGVEAVVNRLREMPPGAEVAWGDDGRAPGGVLSGQIDVIAPAVGDHVGMENWVWTVEEPDPDADGDPLAVVLPYDRTVVSVWDARADDWSYRDAIPLDTPDLAKRLATSCAAAAGIGRVSERGGWTAAAISEGLRLWAERRAGRGDLVFRYDAGLTSPALAKAAEQRRLMEAGERYDVGGGIEVSPAVMDFLAEDPDRAADFMGDLRGHPALRPPEDT